MPSPAIFRNRKKTSTSRPNLMQTAQTTLSPQSETLRLGPAAQRMIVPGLVLAGLGAGLAVICGLRSDTSSTIFYHAYLVAFVFYLTITLGSLFFVLLHHLARAGWSVTLRRLAEALSGNVALMAILFVPLAFNLHAIYPWAEPRAAEQQASGEPHAATMESVQPIAPVEAADGELPSATAGHEVWLTRTNFIGRFVIYFVIWGFLAWYFRGHSILQDSTGSTRLSKSMERLSAPGMILWAVTITLAAVDLIMSLNPHWYSTMIGVYLFSDAVLSSLVVHHAAGAVVAVQRPASRRHHQGALPRPGQTDLRLRLLLGLHRLQPVHAHLVCQHAGRDAVLHDAADRPLGWNFAGPDRHSFCSPVSGLDVEACEAVAAVVCLLADLAVGGPRLRLVLADHAEHVFPRSGWREFARTFQDVAGSRNSRSTSSRRHSRPSWRLSSRRCNRRRWPRSLGC